MAEVSKALQKKLKKRKATLNEKNKGNFLFMKPDTTIRIRPVPIGAENEPAIEMIHFYLGAKIKGVTSPKTIGNPCPIMEKYEELKDSKSKGDKKLSETLKPKSKFVMACVVRPDVKNNKDVDSKKGVCLLPMSKSLYQQIIDLFLDPEQGDFTDRREGYDLKVTRTGAGQYDTEYSVIPCKNSPLDKKYAGPYNLDELLAKEIPSYEEAEEKLNQYLNNEDDDEEDDDDDSDDRKKKLKKKRKDLSKSGMKKKKKKTKLG